MTNISPFTANRFEFEGKHLYYLDADIMRPLEEPTPAYLIGTRGTGKTTLLKALNWERRLQDEHLREQLGDDLFQNRYIGIYIKLPEEHIHLIDSWSKDHEPRRQLYNGIFLELLWSELMLDAVAGLIANQIIQASVDEELSCIEILNQELHESRVFNEEMERRNPLTLRQVRNVLRQARQRLQGAALAQFDPVVEVSRYPTHAPGRFCGMIATHLAQLCNLHNANREPWYFKVCMDEGECLNEFQQKLVGTIIRTCERPFLPVISYVHYPETLEETLINDLTQQRADRRIVELDQMSNASFKTLAEGVAKTRAASILGRPASFDAKQIFGVFDLDALLRDILRDSVNPKAKALLEEARRRADEGTGGESSPLAEGKDGSDDDSDAPPIIETYIDQKLPGTSSSDEPEEETWERRRRYSANYRKRIVAAYLSICNEFNITPRYASAEMIMQISDKCIRDFLLQVDSLFIARGADLEGFLNGGMSSKEQSAALIKASQKKFDNLKSRVVIAPDQIRQVVHGLARLTAALQSRGSDLQHLRVPERGIFLIPLEHEHTEDPSMIDLVRDAAQAGFLRLIKENGQRSIKFRVHASLAPAYEFSYRGAYYIVNLTTDDLKALIRTVDESEVKTWVTTIEKRLASPAGDRKAANKLEDLPLFERQQNHD